MGLCVTLVMWLHESRELHKFLGSYGSNSYADRWVNPQNSYYTIKMTKVVFKLNIFTKPTVDR